jgi:hypothetical protein
MSSIETPLPNVEVPSPSSAFALSSIDNPRNPYYLNNGDNPGILLVPEKLIGENFHTWQISMTRALSAKNKLGFVNGSISQPTDPLDPLYDIWTRCNDLVLSWLTNCMSREIYASVIYVVTAKEIWDELRDRYSDSDGPRVFHLKQAICSLKQEQLPVSTYYTRLKTLWDEYSNYRPIPNCTCGANCTCGMYKILTDYQHKDYVLSFLMGLNESFLQVRGQILLMQPLPPMNRVFFMIQQDEKHRGQGILPLPTVESTALVSRSENAFIPNNAFLSTNLSTNNPSAFFSRMDNAKHSQYGRKDKPTYSHCGYKGHTAEKCYKLHGYPPGFQSRNKATPTANQVSGPSLHCVTDSGQNMTSLAAQCQQFLSLLNAQVQSTPAVGDSVSQSFHHQVATSVTVKQPSSNVPPNMAGIHSCLFSYNSPNLDHSVFSSKLTKKSIVSSKDWIIDTNATDHMVISTTFFTTKTVVHDVSVHLPNGQSVVVTHIGTIHLNSSLILHDVLCVPSFDFNLISVSKLTSTMHCCIFFLSNLCFLQDLLHWKMIGLGKQRNGLYILEQCTDLGSIPIAKAASTAFHNTLYSFATVKKLDNDFHTWHYRLGHPSLSRMSFLSSVVLHVTHSDHDVSLSTVCPLAKQKRLPFPNKNHVVSSPFDLLHVDIWGPYHTATVEGYQYFLTLVDDCTRTTWVYLMKFKSETFTPIFHYHD